MKRRIFIAINLPEKVKEKLLEFQKKWSTLSVRWTKKENLHLTLAFLSYLSEEELKKVSEVTKKVAERYPPFFIELTKIDLGAKYKGVPRLIWAEGAKSQELVSLKKDIERALSQTIRFFPEDRDFLPHITLARIRKWDWQRIEPDERPEICEYLSLRFEVKSIEIMESHLRRGGAEYIILESFKLCGK